eukprot:TRINITY_DN3007_c0_g2_i2.p2 TRINITY_DN3007_c0_g2~~TRINITY_DN3007_c0_g2_i2.p2  ORF type:complete len:100 (+),score=2.36 TRINITY_DN3007_c0_g2_i2:183-482(+)
MIARQTTVEPKPLLPAKQQHFKQQQVISVKTFTIYPSSTPLPQHAKIHLQNSTKNALLVITFFAKLQKQQQGNIAVKLTLILISIKDTCLSCFNYFFLL